ncbi:enoyl-CoA hydratase/isomerase family protein [Corynebacterium comes]|uniref:Enoyl-CoA hydratase echA8 n=1 Tax=Corynebacterium comes TaxID=2675218 RepID=A0A6B8WH28_9CORY|nr:enoyl-CoA hydratase/isomerase family protein [Corynebacterium comes]QGU05878.1 putative enoyl-CoA hydratase echA8 [Corynebacterium comes]
MTAKLLVEQLDKVTVLTLNRPEKLNAMDSETYELMIAALQDAATSEETEVIVVRGNGRAFCTGADVGEFEELTPDQTERVEYRAGLTYNLHKTISELHKPIIAAVQGYAVGGGCGLAAACDITIAGPDVRMGYPEIKHGLVAAVVMANLSKQIGRKAGLELVLTGKLLDAEEAARIGLITRVADGEDPFVDALELAERITQRSAKAIQATKSLYMEVADQPLAEGLLAGRRANERMRSYRSEALGSYRSSVKGLEVSA